MAKETADKTYTRKHVSFLKKSEICLDNSFILIHLANLIILSEFLRD